jgi:molybdenum cofactor biosynthesis protein MoaC
MVNITQKNSTLRKAIAMAVVSVSKIETIRAVQERKVPKGDVFEFARAAGLLAVKKTSDVIPDCHPLPVEYTNISYSIEDLNIIITVEVHTVYKTGVEVEAMHGASVAALVIYDMLKPIDKEVEINNIKLHIKQGGKSQFTYPLETDIKSAVIVCSDSVSSGKKQDTAGKTIVDKLEKFNVHTNHYDIIPDDTDTIRNKMRQLMNEEYDLVIFTGGTGLSPRDNTPEAIAPLINKMIPGIMEAARNYGQQRTPYSMLSRGVAGYAGKTLVLTLPGSTKGAAETMDALFPSLLHVFPVKKGAGHE